jgi:hypothetical protein
MKLLSKLFAVALVSSATFAAAQDLKPEWVGRGFFSCHDTELLQAHFRNGIFFGEGAETASDPLTYFKVVDVRVQNEEDGSLSVLTLVENTLGHQSVIKATPIARSLFGVSYFPSVVLAYFRGVGDLAEWSEGQRAAISEGKVIAGMNRKQVYCSLGTGMPEHVNQYGDELTQEVYKDGALMIYWGPDELVRTVQSFN